jgi:DNA-binding NarL/FixJ family response regulator
VTDDPLRVVMVDDHPIFLRGLHAQFNADPSIEVVGELATAEDAVAAVLRLRPSVTLMDLRIPRRPGEDASYCGADAIREIRRAWPDALIVVMTTYRDPERVRDALSAGACGYLLKEDDSAEFVQKVRLAARGNGVFSDRITKLLPAFMRQSVNGVRPFPQLTDRLREILDLAARGMTNVQIAKELYLEEKSIYNRFREIREKLNVSSRQEAIDQARAAGLGRQLDLDLPENPGESAI